ncbi:MAG: hypothetical protein SF339_23430 [Blastocatellia bacterium]|nr:hypothetical protein [Blastocatellia bacterium]
MGFDTGQRERLTNYLMGRLSNRESEAIEQACLSNPMLTEEIWEIWDELVDAFLRNELSERDRFRIARRIESSPYLRERLAGNQAFLSAMQGAPAKRRSGPGPVKSAAAPAAGRRNFRLCLLAAAIVLVALARLWSPEPAEEPGPAATAAPSVVALSTTPAASPTETTAPPAAHPPATKSDAPLAFFLPYNTVRGEESPRQRLTFPKSARAIQLQVELPFADSTHYRAALSHSDGPLVLSWDRLPAHTYKSVPVLPVQFPVEDLADGEYDLKVTPIKEQAAAPLPISYPIRLERSTGP